MSPLPAAIFGVWVLLGAWVLYGSRHWLAKMGSNDLLGNPIRSGFRTYDRQLKAAVRAAVLIAALGVIFLIVALAICLIDVLQIYSQGPF